MISDDSGSESSAGTRSGRARRLRRALSRTPGALPRRTVVSESTAARPRPTGAERRPLGASALRPWFPAAVSSRLWRPRASRSAAALLERQASGWPVLSPTGLCGGAGRAHGRHIEHQ